MHCLLACSAGGIINGYYGDGSSSSSHKRSF